MAVTAVISVKLFQFITIRSTEISLTRINRTPIRSFTCETITSISLTNIEQNNRHYKPPVTRANFFIIS